MGKLGDRVVYKHTKATQLKQVIAEHLRLLEWAAFNLTMDAKQHTNYERIQKLLAGITLRTSEQELMRDKEKQLMNSLGIPKRS